MSAAGCGTTPGTPCSAVHTGADRLGNAKPDYPVAHATCSRSPAARLFPYAPGGNAVYRRDALLSVGGFDEEYQYYLEETDLCVRLIDRGWLIRQVDGGAIHHKFLPSGIRTSTKVLRDRFAVIKNKVYFSLVNGLERPLDHRGARGRRRVLPAPPQRRELAPRARQHDRRGGGALARVDRPWRGPPAWRPACVDGVALGFGPTTPRTSSGREFLRVPGAPLPERPPRLCFVTQTLPPTVIGGIGRYVLDLSRELAERGHEVHIVTSAADHSTVDLEHGVWVHRIRKDADAGAEAADLPILRGERPGRARPARRQRPRGARRGAAHRPDGDPLDAVYAAMWDVEQLEVLRRTDIPVVTALVTTFAITLRTRAGVGGERRVHDPLRDAAAGARALGAGLTAIGCTRSARRSAVDVEATSGTTLDDARRGRGADRIARPLRPRHRRGSRPGPEPCTVLFVGRFEKRKGIDLLLAAVPRFLAEVPDARVVMVGRNDLAGESGRPYAEEFLDAHATAGWLDRVDIRGEVDDDELWALYDAADVLVAPSRFESFGLIYVEAMMAGLPVVAVDAGAAPEVVEHGRHRGAGAAGGRRAGRRHWWRWRTIPRHAMAMGRAGRAALRGALQRRPHGRRHRACDHRSGTRRGGGAMSPAAGASPRIVVMSGICTRHDAISNVVRTQEEMLVDAGYDVRVYVQHTDFPGGRHVDRVATPGCCSATTGTPAPTW